LLNLQNLQKDVNKFYGSAEVALTIMTARPYYGAGGYSRPEEISKEDGEGRKRKVGTRRTVDYGCTNAKWLLDRLSQRSIYDEKTMRPGLNEVINVHYPICAH
jgi:hypothetical protein